VTRRVYADEFRAVVMAALVQGQSLSAVARQYDMPVGTVADWKKKALSFTDIPRQKRKIGALLIEYLEMNLKALSIQAQAFSDPEWLAAQTASDVAVLHGVMTDKAVRLIEALSNAADRAD
jgi:hypothetical protein